MVLLLPIILAILIAINAFNVYYEVGRINQMLDILSGTDAPLSSNGQVSAGLPQIRGGGGNNTGNTGNTGTASDSLSSGSRNTVTNGIIGGTGVPLALSRFYVITFDQSMNMRSIWLDNATELADDSLATIATAIASEGASQGWRDNYAFRLVSHEEGKAVIMTNTEAVQASLLSVLTTSLLTGLVVYLLVFIAVSLSSKRAISPLMEAYDQQRRFINDVGHELKTPLTVVSANNEIIEMTYGKNEWSDGIGRQTERMRRLFDQMLKLATLEESEEMERAELSLSEVLDETFAVFAAVMPQGCEITADVSANICVLGNEAALRQLIGILLDNAMKYCDEGGVIALEAHAGKRCTIVVTNTYSGADSLDYKSFFDRFYRADSSRSKKEGYGLGLSIAKTIVEKHGGHISARSVDHNAVELCVVL